MQFLTRALITFFVIAIAVPILEVHCISSVSNQLLRKRQEENLLESKTFEGLQACGLRSTRSGKGGDEKRRERGDERPGFRFLTKRIVGGSVSLDGAWPWQVALFLDGSQVCGGSLIRPDWIVSACHCFTDYRSSTDPSRWIVKLGEKQSSSGDGRFDQIGRVKEIFLHPNYWGKTEDGVLVQPPHFDIALLQLSNPALYSSRVYPICLANKDTVFSTGKTCYVTGWGTMGWNKPSSSVLKEAAIPLVPRNECNKKKSYNETVPHSALCAGFKDGRMDACQKDSGGPLACYYDGRWYLVGVVSWGKHCALPDKYGVYADVRVLESWIKSVIVHADEVTQEFQ